VNMTNIDCNLLMSEIDEKIKKNWSELLNLLLDENTKSSMLIQICENKRLKNLKYIEEINMLRLEQKLLERRLRSKPKRTVGTQCGM